MIQTPPTNELRNWFSCTLPEGTHRDTTFIELIAVKACITIWGPSLRDRQLWMNVDNSAIVDVWAKGSCKDFHVMEVVCSLFFLLNKFNINIMFRHLPGSNSSFSDLLSRLQVEQFLAYGVDNRRSSPSIDLAQLHRMSSLFVYLLISPFDPGYV